jgi:branched-chain amino acid transport system substrate-binding protein
MRSEELPELVAPGNAGVLAGMKGTAPASAANTQFLTDLREFAPDLVEVQFAPQVFDCVNAIALAAAVAGTDDPSVFKEEIVGVTKGGTKCASFADCQQLVADGQDIDYDGASGPIEVYSFDEQGQLVVLDTVQSTLPQL